MLHNVTLGEGDDLYKGIDSVVREHEIRAGYIVYAVGELSAVRLRTPSTPNRPNILERQGLFSITMLMGMVAVNATHLHLAVSGEDGVTIGGHVMTEGTIVHEQAEIGIFEDEAYVFSREHDPTTGYDELVVHTT